MDSKNANIIFKSHMFDTDEKIELTAKGIHSVKNGKHYVMYTEELEGGENIRNILKFDSEALDVSKIGTTRTHMYYKAGYKHRDVYRTPFGEYDMCTETEKYVLSETDGKYSIVIVYDLQLGGNHVSKCKVEIEIK